VRQQSREQAVHDSRRLHTPLPQNSPLQRPQSFEQVVQVSDASHTPLPQPGQAPQSAAHVAHDSLRPQVPSPQ
jgi:hypothetical protein